MGIPFFEMKTSKVPIAIIKGGDRQLTFHKVKKYASKFFAIKENNAEGMVFELDDRYEYRYKNSSIYFYNFANSKPISLTGVAEIDKKLRSQGKSQLDNIQELLNTLSPDQLKDFKDDIKDPRKDFSPQTRRFIEDYKSDDEYAKTEMIISLHNKKMPITAYSPPTIGIGFNSGHYAIVQIGHKKLDIVPMDLYNNRAYTPYGVFNFTVDNLYLVKKQMIAFFILNESEDYIVEPLPKSVHRKMRGMVKKGKWSYLETFNKPKRTKMKEQKYGYRLKIEKVEVPDQKDVKDKINASLRPKIKKSKKDDDDKNNMGLDQYDILNRLKMEQDDANLNALTEESLPIEPADPLIEEPIEETSLENFDEPVDDIEEQFEETLIEDLQEPEPRPALELKMNDATGPPVETEPEVEELEQFILPNATLPPEDD